MRQLFEDIRFIMEAGGASAGKLEIANTKVNTARKYAEQIMTSNGRELEKEIPNFDKNYNFAQKQAAQNKLTRDQILGSIPIGG